MAPKSTKEELACLSLGLELELAPSTSAFIGLSKSHDPTQTQYDSSLLRHELWECDSLGSTLKTKYHKLSRFEMSIRYQ